MRAQRREAGRRTYVNMMSGENKVSWPVKDLIPNGEYYFRVQAVNKIGGGEFIELRNPVIAEDQKRKKLISKSTSDPNGLSLPENYFVWVKEEILTEIRLTPDAPDPPVDVETHNPTSSTITLTWKPPMYDGGCKIMGYVLEKQQKGEDKWERCNDFLVPVLSYTVRGLTEGKNYTFRVKAENAAGVSEPSRNTPYIKASDAVGKDDISC